MEWFWRLVDDLQKGVLVASLQNISYSDWVTGIMIFVGLVAGRLCFKENLFYENNKLFLLFKSVKNNPLSDDYSALYPSIFSTSSAFCCSEKTSVARMPFSSRSIKICFGCGIRQW